MSARRPYAARVPIDVRREQLLDAALAIIRRDGYAAVSVDSIAREVGVTRPVVYGAYDGLAPLLSALLDREQVRAFSRLLSVIPEQPDLADPRGLVADVIGNLVAMLREDPATWQVILSPPETMPPALRERVDADRERARGELAALIRGVLATSGGPALDPDVTSHALIGIAEHFGRLILADPQGYDEAPLIRTGDALAGALFPQPRSSEPPKQR
jgi:AcrR family transcriptional regulator